MEREREREKASEGLERGREGGGRGGREGGRERRAAGGYQPAEARLKLEGRGGRSIRV
jgi:hypothetical protein